MTAYALTFGGFLLLGGRAADLAGRRRLFVAGLAIFTGGLARLLLSRGHAATAALTGGFQWAFWVTGLTALAADPVTLVLIRRTELARAVAVSLQREPAAG